MIRDQYTDLPPFASICPRCSREHCDCIIINCPGCHIELSQCQCVRCSICNMRIIVCTCFCETCGQMKCRCDEMDCYFCGTELMMDWDVLDDNADLIETINMCPNLRCNKDKSMYKEIPIAR